MPEIVIVTIIGAIGGLISGTIASLIAPWSQWGVEKSKEKRAERRQRIEDARKAVLAAHAKTDQFAADLHAKKIDLTNAFPMANTYFDVLNQMGSFQPIRAHVGESVLDHLKTSKLLSLDDRGAPLGEMPAPFKSVLDDLARLEKDWKLV